MTYIVIILSSKTNSTMLTWDYVGRTRARPIDWLIGKFIWLSLRCYIINQIMNQLQIDTLIHHYVYLIILEVFCMWWYSLSMLLTKQRKVLGVIIVTKLWISYKNYTDSSLCISNLIKDLKYLMIQPANMFHKTKKSLISNIRSNALIRIRLSLRLLTPIFYSFFSDSVSYA